MVGAQFWDDMREHGFILIDYPARKLAVFSNDCGHVVIAAQDDGVTSISVMEPNEIHLVAAAMLKAGTSAKAINIKMSADYDAHCAIEKARGDFT